MQNIIIAIVLSAFIPFFIKRKHTHMVFAIGFPLLTVMQIFLVQLSHEYETTTLTYAVPISFSVNQIYLNFAVFISILWLLASIYSVLYISKNYGERKLSKFMPFYNIAVGMTLLTAFASNLFTTFIFYELLTLSTLPLVGFGGKNGGGKNGGKSDIKKLLTKYMLILSFCAIAFFLPAIFMFQGAIGTTEFMQGDGTILTLFGQDFPQNESGLNNYQYAPSPLLMVIIFTMMLFGLAKSAIFPFNGWLPAAMCAPAPVSALLHAVAVVNVGVFVMYKVIYELYGTNYMIYLQLLYKPLFIGITIVIVLGMIVASIKALGSVDFKKILAFSTIVNMGYITLLFMTFSEAGVHAGFWHIFVHGITKIGLFFIAGVLYSIYHTNNYRRMAGAFNRHTILAFSLILFSFSLLGAPMTSGFISKQFMVEALSESSYVVLFGVLFSSVTSAVYLFRPVMYTVARTKKQIIDSNLSTIAYAIILPLAIVNIIAFIAGFTGKSFL